MLSVLLCAVVLDSIGKLKALPEAECLKQLDFTLEGHVISSGSTTFTLDDGRERLSIHLREGATNAPPAGSVVRLVGYTDIGRLTREKWPVVRDYTVLGFRPVPPPVDVTPADLRRSDLEYRTIRLHALVTDVFEDEIDPHYRYLLLKADGEAVYASMPRSDGDEAAVARLLEAEVVVTGMCTPIYCGRRMFLGLHIGTTLPQIRITRPAPTDPFAVPELEDLANVSPEAVFRLRRRRVSGTTLAAWRPGRILVRDDANNRILRADLSEPVALPRAGARIAVSGLPATDFYHLNLTKAVWRPTGAPPTAAETPKAIASGDIVSDGRHRSYESSFHGRLVRLRGIVRTLPNPHNRETRFLIESDGVPVPVDTSAVANLPEALTIGYDVAVTGVCVMESENWRADAPFPRITGFFLVPRDDADIAVLSRPPWWTPRLLLGVIGTLFAALVGFFIWNRFLNHLVERRSRELIKQEVARVGSELRVDERTRLAVELHDSLSQTLTGVSFQIDAAERARKKAPDQIGPHLETARRTLQSCRAELRNCLWDLRNNALEEADTASAVRRTVLPHIGDADLRLALDLPRHKISDLTFHAILRMLRELAVNAVRHGHARHLVIRGGLTDETISLAVGDDGCGFDPAARPGADDGHFGLDGIRERLDRLGGTLAIDSAPGRGTDIAITISSHGGAHA